MATTEVRVLGPPTLIKQGRPTKLHSTKTLGLLTFLVLEHGTPHSREKLAELLWGSSSESRARQSLRQALYSLRRILGSEVFIVENDAIDFAPRPEVWVDALEYIDLIERDAGDGDPENQRRAVDLYRGLLLEGAEPSGCPTFDEWLFFRRDDLEQRAVRALQTLIDALLRRGANEDALTYGRQLLTMSPLHEGTHRRLMRIYGALRDRDSVRRQYHLCEEMLEREFGVTPTEATRALYDELMTVATPPPPQNEPYVPPSAQERTFTLPFLGRDQEMARLERAFGAALHGEGQMVLISGEAGVGKSRLVEEFLRKCATSTETPVGVLIGRCYAPESRAPYAMWGDAFEELATSRWQPLLADLEDVWREQVARLVPALGPQAEDIEGATPVESRLRLLQGVVRSLRHLTERRPLILWLDDLHWADEASLELLHYLSRHIEAQPLLIVGTFRPEAIVDNPHLDRLVRSRTATQTIKLPSLERETVERMLSELGVVHDGKFIEVLYNLSEGNPLFLVETVNTLMESGGLRQQSDGTVVTADLASTPVPPGIQDVIQNRLVSIPETHRRSLAAAAVIGRPFGLLLLRQVSGLPESLALTAVDQALTRGFLEERPGALPRRSLAFHHAYIQRVVYEDLSAVQRRALHRRTANALIARHPTPTSAVTEEIAQHLVHAGELQAIEYLVQAATKAEDLYAYQHATILLNQALTLLDNLSPDDSERRFDLLLAREALLERQGRRSEQAEDVAALKELARTIGAADKLAVANLREAGLLSYNGRHTEAHQAGERALVLYREESDTTGEARALRELGFLSWSAGDYGAALTYGRAVLQLHRRRGDVEGEATALHNIAEIHRSLGSPRQALTEYRTALELYWASQDQQRQGLTLYGMGHALRDIGDRNEALTRYRRALRACRAAGDRLMTSRVHHALAGVLWKLGEGEETVNHIAQALEISEEIGYGPGIAYGHVALGELSMQRGDSQIALDHLREALTWLRLIEDQDGLERTQARLRQLEAGEATAEDPFAHSGWIRSHVPLAEGKVYCVFESPMAQGGIDGDEPFAVPFIATTVHAPSAEA